MSYNKEDECPRCGATNKTGNNVENLGGGEYFCHECKETHEDSYYIEDEDEDEDQ